MSLEEGVVIYIDIVASSRGMGRVHKDGEKSMEGVRLCWMVLEDLSWFLEGGGRKESFET